MYSLEMLLIESVKMQASDIHVAVGTPPFFRINGDLKNVFKEEVKEAEIKKMVLEILKDRITEYQKRGEVDTAYNLKKVGRFRINIFREKGNDAIAVRIIKDKILDIHELHIPKVVIDFIEEKCGLILVTGSTGSGKSTTLASLINEINKSRAAHIITLEDPIEYIYKNDKSIINQREIGSDTLGYEEGLNAALREDPDVILVGELRSRETIRAVISAAETGHLVFSTLHTKNAAETVDRIINVFPKGEEEEIRLKLSLVLKGVISEKLIKTQDNKGRMAAFEIMNVTSSIQNLIREGKTYQISSVIQTGKKYGMVTMDTSIEKIYREGYISRDEALKNCTDKHLY